MTEFQDAEFQDGEFQDDFESLAEVEALIRSAGDYVRASEDLRPRVLESARSVRRERRARQWIGQLAAIALALGLLVAAVRQQPSPAAYREPAFQAVRLFSETRLSETQRVVSYRDSSWEMVESFTELRRRQAELLRPAL